MGAVCQWIFFILCWTQSYFFNKIMEDLQLEGKIILITGGSSGLGQNCAVAFANQGAHLALTGRSEDGLAQSKKKCVDAGLPEDKIFTIVGDITKMEDCKKVADETAKYYGRIDILVNNAGIVATGEFEKTPVEKLKGVFETNVRGTFQMTKCVLPWLLATGGNIVFLSALLTNLQRILLSSWVLLASE